MVKTPRNSRASAGVPTAIALAIAGVGLASMLSMSGCRGDRSENRPRQFFPDMDDSPKFKPQTGTDFFADGRSMRPPEAGTVAFGAFPLVEESLPADADWAEPFLQERTDLLGENVALYTGLNEDGTTVAMMPTELTNDLLEHGKERFNIYCAACHGYAGDGMGMVGRRWSAPVPSFHQAKYKDRSEPTGTDGHIFHIARNGLKHPDGRYRMPGYGHALSAEDTWAVVAHIRVLQQAFDNDPQSLPAEARTEFESGGRPTQGGGQ